MNQTENCRCTCGHVKFSVRGRPLFRGYCHCTLCQKFNAAPYADITLFRPGDVGMPEPASVTYTTLRSFPAAQRGVCSACGKPAIEYLQVPPMPKLIIVPTANIREAAMVPVPALHIFYDTRVADVDDGLPKYEGYWKSQLAIGHRLILALLRQ